MVGATLLELAGVDDELEAVLDGDDGAQCAHVDPRVRADHEEVAAEATRAAVEEDRDDAGLEVELADQVLPQPTIALLPGRGARALHPLALYHSCGWPAKAAHR